YQEMGRLFAHVELIEGGQPGDRRVVFRITEGPTVKVTGVEFVGNSFVSGERLRVQTNTSRALLNTFGADSNPTTAQGDVIRLEDYYRTYGLQDVRVHHEKIFSADTRGVKVVFHIAEGARYQVKRIELIGNKNFTEDRVIGVTKLRAGQNYDRNVVQAD